MVYATGTTGFCPGGVVEVNDHAVFSNTAGDVIVSGNGNGPSYFGVEQTVFASSAHATVTNGPRRIYRCQHYRR